MENVFKRILNVNIERRYYAKGVDEEVKRLYPEFKHMAELSQEERMAIIRQEWGKIKELDETYEVKQALKAIYEALGRLENPEKVFKNEKDYTETKLSKDHLKEDVTEEIAEEIKKDNTLVVLEETGELNIDDINEDLDLFIEALEAVTGREYTISHEVGKSVIKEYK